MITRHYRPELLPPARQFYEGEGFRLGRANSKGWAMAQGQPPCHKSKSGRSFSVNLNSGAFHCFGWDAGGGGLVDYVQLRDGCTFKEGAQYFGAWDSAPSPETVRKLEAQASERRRQQQLKAQREAEEHRRRIQLRDEAHTAARIQREASDRLTELQQGATPVSDGDEEAAWAVMSLALDDLRDCERAYCAAAGLSNPWSVPGE